MEFSLQHIFIYLQKYYIIYEMLSAKVDTEQRKIDARMQSCNREKTEQQL